jgi:para-aminobenzoate synthetase/4-amino-4-deoxychorismate lyase
MSVNLPDSLYSRLIGESNVVLLETSKYDRENFRSYLFTDPVAVITINAIDEVPYLFSKIEEYLKQNYYLAGYLCYECGYHFEKILSNLAVTLAYPIAWFGVYERPIVFNHLDDIVENYTVTGNPVKEVFSKEFKTEHLEFNIPHPEYIQKIGRIKDYIAQGDVYQINFTGKYTFKFSGSSLGLYECLKRKQNVSYGAFINTDGLLVCSLSPELFFRLEGDRITTKPMKGTARRGKTPEEDEALREGLRNDVKNKAENLMIVDLLRNDIGRISKFGSVRVSELFSVEHYQTLFQMTSTVEGRILEDVNHYELFKAIFPGGSVTGAPKIRAMEIINELESEPRGIYTGSIGYFSPERKAVFNIAIRTVVICKDGGEMGTGGGIVWDSDPESEYEECRVKAHFLTNGFSTDLK